MKSDEIKTSPSARARGGLVHAELLGLLAKSIKNSLSPLGLNKLARVLQGLAAGEGVHVCSAAGLISWRGNPRPLTCPFMATETYSGRFLAWLTEAEKTVLDEVLAQREKSDAAQRVPTSGKEGLGDAA